jgi:hypothetical protein
MRASLRASAISFDSHDKAHNAAAIGGEWKPMH